MFGSPRSFHRAMHLNRTRFCREVYAERDRLVRVGMRQLAIRGTLYLDRGVSGCRRRIVGVSPNGELTVFRDRLRTIAEAEALLAKLESNP